MIKLQWRKLHQTGDTLVEVLIAILIISLVLSGAYVTSNASLRGDRKAQEHAEATQLLKGQVESLRIYAAEHGDTFFGGSHKLFCFNDTPDVVDFSGSDHLPSRDSDDYSTYPSACKNVGTRYNLSVQYDASNNDLFTFVARWDQLGQNKDEVIFSYRIHPTTSLGSPSPPTSTAGLGDCSTDPTACVSFPPEPLNPFARLFYTMDLRNNSDNPALTVVGCTWDWGDGSQDHNHACNYGDWNHHCYSFTIGDYSSRTYSVTLTMKFADGPDATTTYTTYPVPYSTFYYSATGCSQPAP